MPTDPEPMIIHGQAAEFLYVDPVGNQMIVRPLTSRTVVLEILAEELQAPRTVTLIVTPGALQEAADAARRAASA